MAFSWVTYTVFGVIALMIYLKHQQKIKDFLGSRNKKSPSKEEINRLFRRKDVIQNGFVGNNNRNRSYNNNSMESLQEHKRRNYEKPIRYIDNPKAKAFVSIKQRIMELRGNKMEEELTLKQRMAIKGIKWSQKIAVKRAKKQIKALFESYENEIHEIIDKVAEIAEKEDEKKHPQIIAIVCSSLIASFENKTEMEIVQEMIKETVKNYLKESPHQNYEIEKNI